MRTKALLVIAAAVALVAGSDCQRQATRVSSFGLEPRSMTVPAAMGPLIPADAVGLVYMASIDEAERSLGELRQESASDSSRIDIAAAISGKLHIPAESIDRKRPVAIALSLVNLGRPIPLPTVILPVRNEREALEQLRARPGAPEPLGNRGWVGVPLVAGYERGTGIPPIAKNLQAGVIAARLQVEPVLKVVQPFVDAGLQALLKKAAEKEADTEGTQARLQAMRARVAAATAQQTLDLLRATETLDCGIRIRDGNLAVAYRMLTTPESRNVAATAERAEGLADLAHCVPVDYPVMGLVAMDFTKPIAFHKTLYTGVLDESMHEVPEPLRESIHSMMERSLDLYRLADDRMFQAMRFGDSGAEVIQVLSTRDAPKFVDECQKILGFELLESAGLGSVEPEEPVVVDGVEIHGMRVRLNFEQMMQLQAAVGESSPDSGRAAAFPNYFMKAFSGGDAMVVRFAAVGDQVVVVTHPDREIIVGCIAALKQSAGRVPPSLREVQRLAKDPLCFWARVDFHGILVPMLDAAHAERSDVEVLEMRRKIESMAPFPVTVYMTAGHQAYQGACSLNVESIVALAKLVGQDPASPEPDESQEDSETKK